MPEPTQAQIEAAAKAIRFVLGKNEVARSADALAHAALTAAAEVEGWNSATAHREGYDHGVHVTIEACAQVADNESEAPGEMPQEFYLVPLEDAIRAAIRATKKSIAAAIRALKE